VRPGELLVLPPRRAYPEAVGFPLACSTRLYPEAPFVALPHVPDELETRVAIALLSMPKDGEVARSTASGGWVLPGSYGSLHLLMRELHVGPYSARHRRSLMEFLREHWAPVLASLTVLAALLAGLLWRGSLLNRRLHASRAALHAELTRRLASEAQFRGVFEHSALGICLLDAGGAVCQINPAYCALLGRSREELLRRDFLSLLHPSSDSPDRLVRQILGGSCPPSGSVATHLGEHGAAVPVRLTVSPVKDESGAASHIIVIAEDLSARQRLEAELHAAQRLETVGRLAAGVAHHFNNLLTVINGHAALGLRESPADSPPHGHFSPILEAGGRAADLVRQLLAFSRKQMRRLQSVDLSEVARGFAAQWQAAPAPGLTLELELSAAPLPVWADPRQLEQVLTCLLDNSLRAMPEGGRMRIVTRSTELPAGVYALLEFSDTGPGIPESVRPHLFEPFFTTQPFGEAAGLGLATVYGIVKQSDGHIEVADAPQGGALFRIFLPTAP
jgi:PAS domain S-box-containing protein